ncbi:hypothetical protein Cni_G15944 [Canna indica]|uniref:Benzyl alcohol O-benzoyltransferase n=1 Tax=Canna indica TaxID=4628 RepID=A0AAQ3QC54_9LILI|nr:hypothetical protein Cni_G15944 [Canna indica]
METPVAGFTVRRRKPELVPPAGPTPHEFKRLSDIDDQDGLRSFVPIIQYYPTSGGGGGKGDRDPVEVIRDALARALVFYYPLAGRLREAAGRKLVVECTGEGVIFVEADADVRLEQLGNALHPPIPFLSEVLHNIPGSDGILHCPLLLMQVTRLLCGGFIVATRLNHTMADGSGHGQLMLAVSELARGAAAPSVFPVWARELLEARNPPRITCFHREYEHTRPPDSGGEAVAVPPEDMEHRSFFFGRKDIATLRRLMPPNLRDSSTFEILTACLWRCRTAAINPGADKEVRAMFTVNARSKRYAALGLPPGYYGNAIAYAVAITTAGELCTRPVGYALELLRKVKAEVSDEYIRSVPDLMVLRGRPHYVTAGAYLVSDATRTGLENVDYGWGRPLYGGPAYGRVASFHLAVRNREGEDGIAVPHYLPRSTMSRFAMELEKLIKEEPRGRRSPL